MSPIQTCTEILENVQFYRTDKADCWIVDEALVIEQTFDGFVRYVYVHISKKRFYQILWKSWLLFHLI